MSPTDDSLTGRYGAPSRAGRLGLIAVVAVIVVAALAMLTWITLFHANPEIASEEIGHAIVDDHLATIEVRIQIDDGLDDPTCSLRAISHDKAVVGEASFVPDPAEGPVYEIEVRTERRATTVEWIGCRAPGQPRYR
ncbi:hypothetical protein ASE01_09395 [Nocardioides sp. Root190]|uniref:DUF4307 domain-containing protein n=1 Tax=Nocardioides sp. Root190 TaxID=1736488 RepID=UPI0006F7366B|nr:DUF4307 domain-containing protein [Nocardioides sp. Root190]KRB76973.1 hypothetical protein ASE01_09395 [Nocardioides sp. Root190]